MKLLFSNFFWPFFNRAYDLYLAEAMNDLQEQVKVEHVPAEKNEQGIENYETWPPDEVF